MNNYKPLSRSESKFVTQDEDFIALAGGQDAGWFDDRIEHMLRFIPGKVRRVSVLHYPPNLPPSRSISAYSEGTMLN